MNLNMTDEQELLVAIYLGIITELNKSVKDNKLAYRVFSMGNGKTIVSTESQIREMVRNDIHQECRMSVQLLDLMFPFDNEFGRDSMEMCSTISVSVEVGGDSVKCLTFFSVGPKLEEYSNLIPDTCDIKFADPELFVKINDFICGLYEKEKKYKGQK